MDFSTRGFQRNNEARPATPAGSGAPGVPQNDDQGKQSAKVTEVKVKRNKFLLVLVVLLTAALLALAVATIVGLSTRKSESSYVNSDKYQAVFISGSQLPYFGKITEMNSRYLVLEDIFYLNVTTGQVQPGSSETADQQVSLVKLGCSELHGPYDSMVINRETVQFWENLKSDGKVVKAINSWRDAGGKCETTTSTNSSSSSNSNSNSSSSSNKTNSNSNSSSNSGN